MKGVSFTTFTKVTYGALIALALVFPATSRADTFVQTSDHCSVPCGIDTNNTVTISQFSADAVEIRVSLDTNWFFVTTGAGDASFAFSSSLAGLGLAILPTTSSFASWTTTVASSLKMDGLTYPTTAYGAIWGGGNGGGAHDGGFLDFTVTSQSALSVASFLASLQGGLNGSNPTNALFAADVISPASGNPTGIIDFSSSPVPVPALGAGLPGLIAACMGLLVFSRRRRHRFA